MRSTPLLLCALALGCGSSAATEVASGGDSTSGSRVAQPNRGTGGGEALATNQRADCANEPVYFAYDSSELDASSREKLSRSARCLDGQRPGEIVVTGMTDPRGTEEYNLALGERRAHSVRTYMQSLGVRAGNVRAVSVGEEMASGRDEGTWARDRRAEMQAR